jgi:hypothetical protein
MRKQSTNELLLRSSCNTLVRVQKKLLMIEAITNDVMLNDSEKIEQIDETINQYYE